jgi:hypothetical protein
MSKERTFICISTFGTVTRIVPPQKRHDHIQGINYPTEIYIYTSVTIHQRDLLVEISFASKTVFENLRIPTVKMKVYEKLLDTNKERKGVTHLAAYFSKVSISNKTANARHA